MMYKLKKINKQLDLIIYVIDKTKQSVSKAILLNNLTKINYSISEISQLKTSLYGN